MKGIVDKIWQNKTKDKKDYWVLTIDGERYSVWDKDYMKGIQEGATVEYEWGQSGDFKKITGMNVLDAGPEGRALVKPGYKDQQIVRMACLKSASSLLSGLEAEPQQKGQVTLGLARKFEKYVTERDEDILEGSENHEREPGEEV